MSPGNPTGDGSRSAIVFVAGTRRTVSVPRAQAPHLSHQDYRDLSRQHVSKRLADREFR